LALREGGSGLMPPQVAGLEQWFSLRGLLPEKKADIGLR
jgi:hypothetical protein